MHVPHRALLVIGLTVTLVVAACTADSRDAEEASGTGDDPGRLVVIDDAGDVVIMNADGSDSLVLSEEGASSARQAVWSPDGDSVAWSQPQPSGGDADVVIAEVGTDARMSILTPNPSFYLSWSPDSAALGALYQGAGSIELSVIDVIEQESTVVDMGAPFYISWDPGDSGRFVAHIGEERLEVFERDGRPLRSLTTSSAYLAPFWSDAGIIHVENGSMVVAGPDDERQDVAPVSGLALFVPTRAGDRVAVQVLGEGPAITVSRREMQSLPPGVSVIDVATGEVVPAHDTPVVGMFWSPDSESLLLMAPSPTDDALIEPIVWSESIKVELPEFRPSLSLARDVLPFFPQYAQSLSFWSPDSSRFAYPGEVDGESGIWVQDVGEGTPVRVSDGSWVAWSP